MHPRDTRYTLVTHEQYAACERFRATETDVPPHDWGFPVVMAQRDGHILGYLGTYDERGDVVAGPLVMPRVLPRMQRVWVMLRLLEALEPVFQACGVTSYWMTADATDTHYCDILGRLGLVEVHRVTHEGSTYVWFLRQIYAAFPVETVPVNPLAFPDLVRLADTDDEEVPF